MNYTIRDFVDKKEQFILPSIQREYVWEEEQICRLFDSLLRSFPIGHMLLWKLDGKDIKDKGIDFYKFLDNYDEMNPEYNQKLENPSPNSTFYAILDGQQRTQSIFIGLRGYLRLKVYRARKDNVDSYKNKYLYINLLYDKTNDDYEYELKFLADEELKNEPDKLWYKMGEILTCNEVPDVNNIKTNLNLDEESKKIANENLKNIYFQINDNKKIISIDEISGNRTLDEILDIFVRTNSGGTVLNKTDLLFSTIVSSWPEARNNVEELLDIINNKGGQGPRFKFTKDFVMRTLLYLLDEPVTLKIKDMKKNIEIIKTNWDNLSSAIREIPNILKYLGYSSENLVSYNAVMPIIYYCYKGGKIDVSTLNEFRKYLVIAQLNKLFGVASNSTLTNVRTALVDKNRKLKNKKFKLSDLKNVNIVGDRSFKVDNDTLESWFRYDKGDYTFMILSLLYPCANIASSTYHQDHMHPASILKKTKFSDLRNRLANLQLLEDKENESKQDMSLEDWLKKDRVRRKNTKYLPKCSYKIEDYEVFLEKRKELMKKELKKILELD